MGTVILGCTDRFEDMRLIICAFRGIFRFPGRVVHILEIENGKPFDYDYENHKFMELSFSGTVESEIFSTLRLEFQDS